MEGSGREGSGNGEGCPQGSRHEKAMWNPTVSQPVQNYNQRGQENTCDVGEDGRQGSGGTGG